MKYIAILLVFIQINAFGLDLEFYLRIPIPTNIANAGAGGASMVSIPTVVSRNDGAFIFQDLSLPKFGIAVRPNKTFFYYCPKDEYYTQTNKIISSTIQGNTRIDISESTLLLGSIKTNPDLILKTISNNGVIIELSTNETKSVSVHRVVSSIQPAGFISGQQISESSIKESALVIEKYDSKQNIIESKSFNSNIKGSQYDINSIQTSSSFKIYAELKPGYIYFYRLTDSDLLSSPNRITLGSSQNGSLTATVNNPEQALLNIQSSTNLIDWKTFKTIQNEPSLEIIVPANKPKEFIRAIE